jgi:hypothetical protein
MHFHVMRFHVTRFHEMHLYEVRFTKLLFAGTTFSEAFCSGGFFVSVRVVIRARGGCLERVEQRAAGAALEAR